MQFEYAGHTINLLDTPGHEDFSEDTYRVLTAVDAAVMVIDAAKGVEAQTIKLLEVCRLRATPIITFINKMDREVREPLALLEEIESVLEDRLRADHAGRSAWASAFAACTTCCTSACCASPPARSAAATTCELIEGLDNPRLDQLFPDEIAALAPRCRADPRARASVRHRRISRGTPDAGFLRLGHQQFRRAGDPAGAGRMGAAAAAARRRRPRIVQPAEAPFTRLRVQDPGEHGSASTATASRFFASARAAISRA